MVVLKNCEPEISHIVAELFSKCVKEPCFPDCWKVLGHNQLIVWFASATCPNVELKNTTFLGGKKIAEHKQTSSPLF